MKVNPAVSIVGGLLLALTLSPRGGSAAAAESSARQGGNCARACLEGIAQKYLSAVLLRDPSRAPLAEHVKFSENNVSLLPGDGLWGTITGKGAPSTELLFADPEAGQVGFFGVVDEHGVPGYIGVRLKIEDRKIAEIETLVNRIPPLPPGASPSPFATQGPKELQHFPAMTQAVPAGERVSRPRLIDIANGYFSTLQQNDGQLFAPFDEQCSRMENGNVSAGDPNASYPAAKIPCGEQFKKGAYRFDSAVRDRDFMLVDEERQLVLTRSFLDHNAVLTDFKLADGTPAVSGFKTPSTLCMLELFKIRSGRIFRVEVVYINVPYHMPSVWKNVE
ncbi:MAG: hypothetical protein JWM63_3572 [Gammaproteobacteria bacterium]|nr:hypothetical protein [Gammaproteobacteria bacterium]